MGSGISHESHEGGDCRLLSIAWDFWADTGMAHPDRIGPQQVAQQMQVDEIALDPNEASARSRSGTVRRRRDSELHRRKRRGIRGVDQSQGLGALAPSRRVLRSFSGLMLVADSVESA